MRTLIIISHPTIEESLNQQFFKEASAGLSSYLASFGIKLSRRKNRYKG